MGDRITATDTHMVFVTVAGAQVPVPMPHVFSGLISGGLSTNVRLVSLYRRRGTKQNLQDLLSIFTRGVPTIDESDAAGPAHSFRITMRLPRAAPDVQLRQTAIAHALIDLEKPAHTDYELDLPFPTMQIGVSSTIGVDTLLGTGGDTDPGGAIAAPKVTANKKP